MKKVQRSFAVEYRSGRRKANSTPSSIWGDIDLRSVAQSLREEEVPILAGASKVPSGETSSPEKEEATALLTLPIEQETSALALQETTMADETIAMTDTDAPAVATPEVLKKARKPRAKKAMPETISKADSTQVSVEPIAASGKQKRGRKAKSDGGATSVKRALAKRVPKLVAAAPAPSAAAVDEFADLLQLEEENQKLRKLLSEKLRAENADLRKRLNLD